MLYRIGQALAKVYGAIISFLGLGFSVLAFAAGLGRLPFALLFAWSSLAFVVVGIAYAAHAPGLFGKRADGSFVLARRILLLPFLVWTELNWNLYRLVTRERVYDEVSERVWVGRWPRATELPEGAAVVIDVTAELRVRGRHAAEGREYVALPTLDADAPLAGPLAALVAKYKVDPRGLYIHCAFGHGRSASVAAALLVARGAASTVEEAEASMKLRRPRIGLNRAQRRSVKAALALLSGGALRQADVTLRR